MLDYFQESGFRCYIFYGPAKASLVKADFGEYSSERGVVEE